MVVGLAVGFFEGLDVGFLVGAGVSGAGSLVGAEVIAPVLPLHDSAVLQNPSPITPLLFSQAKLALQLSVPMLASF